MRETINDALKTAMKAGDRRRTATLRLINAAIKDRDIAGRPSGKAQAGDDDLLQLLAKMIKQREESAKLYDDGGRPELAAQEREEIAIIREFMPRQMSEAETEAAVKAAVDETGATSVRDTGRVMALLKDRFAGQMDFAKASGVAKGLLS